jgi:predicted ATPase
VSALPAGEFARARAHLKEALALYDAREHRAPAFVYAFDPRVVCLDYLARALVPLGFPDQALAISEEAVGEARRVGHRNSLALPLFFGGVIRQILGDLPGVRDRADELAQIAAEAGFRFWAAGASILQAWTIAKAGDPERGRAELQKGFDEWRATGARFMSPYFMALRAEIEMDAGDAETAVQLLRPAQHAIETTGERWFAAEVLRLQGEALAKLGAERTALARERFSDAVETARAQGARLWELRAALGLARLGDSAPADLRELARILGSFTEGFGLAELQAARAVTASAEAA